MQYFGFNKQVLVQTKKEMHTVVNNLSYNAVLSVTNNFVR
jgi:hypothetical protein